MSSPATMSDVSQLLGEVDPLIADRILAMGATADEIAEALREVEEERGFGEEPHEPSNRRVAEIRAMIYELRSQDDDLLEQYDVHV